MSKSFVSIAVVVVLFIGITIVVNGTVVAFLVNVFIDVGFVTVVV